MTSPFKPVIVVDSREHHPYAFQVESVCRALPAGDYSLEGMEAKVAVERKSLDDFVSTVTHGRTRFKKELAKLCKYEAACVVVEGGLQHIVQGNFTGRAHPNAILGSVISIIIDFRVPVYFCNNRQIACWFTEHFLMQFYKRHSRLVTT